MNLLADESIDREIVESLRREGHLVWYVAEMEPGISDRTVLDLANQKNALLLTADKDFGEIVFRQRRLSRGVILLRLAGLSSEEKARIVRSLITFRERDLLGSFSVVTSTGVRIRKIQHRG